MYYRCASPALNETVNKAIGTKHFHALAADKELTPVPTQDVHYLIKPVQTRYGQDTEKHFTKVYKTSSVGAGKTSTLKMLTGDIRPTAGDAFLGKHSINTSLTEGRRLIGNCPQFDPIFAGLTPREHLELFARIKVRCCFRWFSDSSSTRVILVWNGIILITEISVAS